MSEHSDQLLIPENLPTFWQRFSLRLLQRLGWRMHYAGLPGSHGLIIVYPHTSNWDVLIGLLGKWTIAEPVHWLAKEKLFRGLPGLLLGPVLRRLGAEPVERGISTGAIHRLAQRINSRAWYWLALAPEGTRSYRPDWRSGFYHVALEAQVPLLVVGLDYASKTIRADRVLHLSGDKEKDRAMLIALYRDCRGLVPENAAPIDW